jgi:hypothetical protein
MKNSLEGSTVGGIVVPEGRQRGASVMPYVSAPLALEPTKSSLEREAELFEQAV